MNETLVLAHSPDSDDAFMFYGLRENAVDTEGVSYRHELADIETLNRRALEGELAITAVSFHAYAYLADRYLLLPHGASFGDGYGPCVVAREAAGAPADARGPRGAARRDPGPLTTAALALTIYAPALDPRRHAVRPRRRGRDARRRGRRASSSTRASSPGRTRAFTSWRTSASCGRTRPPCPLPLGGNAVRKDLGPELIARVSRALGRSIEYALDHREDALTDAMRFARGLPREKADRFVAMYVNDWTRSYGERGREAVRLLPRARARGGSAAALVTPEWVEEG